MFDDGAGPALYVGGNFLSAGGVTAHSIARWDGAGWSEPAGGIRRLGWPSASVLTLRSANLGAGPSLYVGGLFDRAGSGAAALNVARWDGSSWSAMGAGIPAEFVTSFEVIPSGGGVRLAAGAVNSLPPVSIWDGSQWTGAGDGINGFVRALAFADVGAGPTLVCGGDFGPIGPEYPGSLAQLRRATCAGGPAWSVGIGARGVDGVTVQRARVLDDGTGPALYLAGQFAGVGGVRSAGLIKRSAAGWTPMGLGDDDSVDDVLAFDDGGGLGLYAAGCFRSLGAEGPRIARLRGGGWTLLPDGASAPMAVCDLGGGASLYATRVTGPATATVRRWTGSQWADVGVFAGGAPVKVLKQVDPALGPRLCAAGSFAQAAGHACNGIALWDGVSWSPMGPGLSLGGGPGTVMDVEMLDDGAGRSLHACGWFDNSGGAPVSMVARWNGQSWQALGTGPGSTTNALAVFDDGSGPGLYAAGAYGIGYRAGLMRWSGGAWHEVPGHGPSAPPNCLAVFDDGSGPALWVGGPFSSVGDLSSSRIAVLRPCQHPACYADCDFSSSGSGTPSLNAGDFVCFLGKFWRGDPYANCDGSTAAPVLNALDFVCFLNRFAAGCS